MEESGNQSSQSNPRDPIGRARDHLLRLALTDAHHVLRDPFGFFCSLGKDRESGRHRPKHILAWFTLFSLVPSLLIPVWKPLTDWAIETSAVKVPDLHFGNQAYVTVARDYYPLFYSYVGNHLLAWLACVPILVLDLVGTLLVASVFMHLLFKHLLCGNGRWEDALAALAFGDLPSLLFGFLPYSAAIGLAWTTLLQIPVAFHYLYRVSWNRAFIPYGVFLLIVFVAWGVWGTASPSGFLAIIQRGPYRI